MDPNTLRFRLLNDFQRDFPLEPRPFARIGTELKLSEEDVIGLIEDLQAAGAISRVGAVVRPNTVGASTLAALSASRERLDHVAAIVAGHPEVNHCYEREHAINLWFVVTARERAAVSRVLDDIAAQTGLEVLDLPMERDYHIDLGFDLR